MDSVQTTIRGNRYLITNQIAKIIKLLNPERWNSREMWYKMLVGLVKFSRDSGDANKYLDLCMEISELANHGDPETIKQLWESEHDFEVANIDMFVLWLKQDDEEAFCELFRSLGIYKDENNYTYHDAHNFARKDVMFYSDEAKDHRNNVYRFINSCIIPFGYRNWTYLIKSERHNTKHDYKYATYEMVSKRGISSLKNIIVGVEIKNGKSKDISMADIIDTLLIDNNFCNLKFYPFSIKKNINTIATLSEHGIFNMFGGFNFDYDSNYNIDEELVKPALRQISEFCSGDQEYIDFFIRWLARIVQYPERKTERMIIIKSSKDIDKSAFFSWFGRNVIGSQHHADIFYECSLPEFRSTITAKLLTVLDEVNVFDKKGCIKEQFWYPIVEQKHTVKYPGWGNYEIKNCNNFVVLVDENTHMTVMDTKLILYLEPNKSNDIDDNYREYLRDVFYKDSNSALNFYHYLMRVEGTEPNLYKPHKRLAESVNMLTD